MRPVKPEKTFDCRALVVDVDTASIMLQTSKTAIYKMMHEGLLDTYLDGRRRRITVASIKSHIERKLTNATFRRERFPTRAPPDAHT